VVIVRDSAEGPQVLLMRRAERGDLNSGAWVFPGGLLDPADHEAAACCAGLNDAEASRRLGLEHGGLAWYVAALRECFEEAGLWYGHRGDHHLPSAADTCWAPLAADRGALYRGELTLQALCEAHGMRLALDRLAYISHWVTPLGRAKRFDTRFFLAAAPEGQVAAHDEGELVEQRWLTPAQALAEGERLKLMTPTLTTLQTLRRFDSVQAMLAWAHSLPPVQPITPRLADGPQGLRPVLPHEPAYAEIGRLDPEGRGHARYDLRPGVPTRLGERVIRVTADNGSVMTGPGTNTYLVGGGPRNEWAVIDPGPADPAHVQAVLAAAPGPVTRIFVTHTHRDHSPAAASLAAQCGAAVLGRVADHPDLQDAGFAPTLHLHGGERFELDEGVSLRVLHTPGHASNHLCYLLEQERLLFAGDHVMQLSTVVINPPDGDMAAYLRSLRALQDEELEWIAPGHGFLMPEPRQAMEAIVQHRLRREAKVVAALQALQPATLPALLARVYEDVRPALHPVALRSLQAHLLKLRDDGRAAESEGGWHWLAP
jgi:glyoxylase-like metal-dependent hydrolase (beta-lactamase superfamily II)/8-oxo-dGTP pyrophosphatase MutT (NUDIX family)